MTDIATLGLKITSNEAVTAAGALDRLAVSAGKADSANTKMAASSKVVSIAEKQQAMEAQKAAAAQQQLERSMRSAAIGSTIMWKELNVVKSALSETSGAMSTVAQKSVQATQAIVAIGGGSAVVRGLGVAFFGLLNPISLVQFGIYSLGAAIVEWVTQSNKEVASFADQISKVDSAIASLQKSTEIYSLSGVAGLAEKYGEVNAELLIHIERMREIEKMEGLKSFSDAIQTLKGEMTGGWLTSDIDDLRNAFGTTNDQARYMLGLMEQIKSGRTFDEQADAVIALRTAINDATGGFENATGAAKDLSDKVQVAYDRVLQLRQSAPDGAWMNAAIDGVSGLTGSIMQAIGALGALAGAQVKAMMGPSAYHPASPEMLQNYSQYGQGQSGMIDAINNDRPRYGGDGNGLTDGQFKSMYPVARRSGGGRRASGGGGGGASKAASEAANAAKKYADLVANQNQHIEMLALETKAVGMSEQAARAMLLTQELLNKAQQGGTKVTAEQTLAITKLAEETAIAEEKLRQTKETFDFISSTAKGFFKDFFEGIKNGESVWESFKEAGLNALEKIADKLIDMALQNLFANAFSGGAGNDPWAGLRKTGGGGGGGIFDILGSLFGGFFAEGGDVRGGKAIVVGEQGPELFMPKTAGSIIPNHAIHAMNNNQPSAANGNGGTLHVTGQFEVINGNIIPVMTKVAGQVSGQQIATAAPMIAGTAVKRASENVVPTMSRYQNDRAGSDYRVA